MKEALIKIDHWLHLESKGALYLDSLVPHLIDGVARHFVITLLVVATGAYFSSANQVCFVLLFCILVPILIISSCNYF